MVLPIHRELARGTLSAILRRSGVAVNEFIIFLLARTARDDCLLRFCGDRAVLIA